MEMFDICFTLLLFLGLFFMWVIVGNGGSV